MTNVQPTARNELVIRYFREYYNKGRHCLYIQTHDGADYKFILATEEEAIAKGLPTQLQITRPPMALTDEDETIQAIVPS